MAERARGAGEALPWSGVGMGPSKGGGVQCREVGSELQAASGGEGRRETSGSRVGALHSRPSAAHGLQCAPAAAPQRRAGSHLGAHVSLPLLGLSAAQSERNTA
jgi:hypothetical protein